tara:strand:+ start:1468 stop:2289 length:822 start_codon:yes stop_codon:yes gene_type:complete
MRYLSMDSALSVIGTVRDARLTKAFPKEIRGNIETEINLTNADLISLDSLANLIERFNPEVVINCIGIIKQLEESNDPLKALTINSILPHQLARICETIHSRLIHLSTDCVFSGKRGMYKESDEPDATDLYGISKRLGEVTEKEALTLRTSIIGHELNGNRSLINWFLSQKKLVKGYKEAIFSGLPTIEIAKIIKTYVLPNPELKGLYHVSAEPIDKYSLLKLVAEVYEKNVRIEKDFNVKIDRSLDSGEFHRRTGYKPPSWGTLIERMCDFR